MDKEGDGVIVGPVGPRQVTTQGYIASKGPINRQAGLGLPSFNAKPLPDGETGLTGEDQRILSALGYDKVNSKE